MKHIFSLLIILVFQFTTLTTEARTRSNGYKNASAYLSKPKKKHTTKHVSSYKKKNGTRVKAHRRSTANYTKKDNWSHKGNYNSYTRKKGTKRKHTF